MNAEVGNPPGRMPTLTEVIDPSHWPTQAAIAAPDGADRAPRPAAAPADARAPVSEAQLVQRVLIELQNQIDVMLEYRVREVLGPLLARTADNLVRDVRSELASTLRDVVARAVANELARHRARP